MILGRFPTSNDKPNVHNILAVIVTIEEWGAERLERVAAYVDAAIDELVSCAFEPLDPVTCARLLYGERGFWLAELIDPADPPPAYGRFAHVRLDALEARAAARIPASAGPAR